MDLRRVDNTSSDIVTYPPHYVTCEHPYCSVSRSLVARTATVKMFRTLAAVHLESLEPLEDSSEVRILNVQDAGSHFHAKRVQGA